MNLGMAGQEYKDLREAFKIKFEDESFPLSPPALDEWMLRWVKSLTNSKSVLAQEKELISAQFKILDVASPLLKVLVRLNKVKDNPVSESVLPATKAY